MLQLTLTQTVALRSGIDSLHLTADGRFVGLRRGRYVSVYDAATGRFLFNILLASGYYSLSISPNGMALAASGKRELVMIPAHEQKHGRRVRRSMDNEDETVDLEFTADGEYLWCAFQRDGGAGRLALLRASTLEELAAVPVPHGDLHPWSYKAENWPEVSLCLNVATNTLSVTRKAGDSFLGTFFFRQQGDRIQQMPYYASDEPDVRPPYHTFFNEDGTRFAAADGGLLWLWQLPEMALIGRGFSNYVPRPQSLDETDPPDRVEEYAGEFTFIDSHHIVFAVVREVFRKSITVRELRTLDTRTSRIVDAMPLPHPFGHGRWQFMHYNFCAMRGRTCVGIADRKVFIYQLDLIP